jgi:hypothetical protein
MSTVVASSPFALASSPSRGDLLAKYFRGLGDPTRLRILQLLEDSGELAVGEIVEWLELPQATVPTVALASSLLEDNAEHVACCQTIDAPAGATARR